MEVSVTDFGPIARATVRLRPLTILFGPSNSGKSYLMTLVYSLFQAMHNGVLPPASYHADFLSPVRRTVLGPGRSRLYEKIYGGNSAVDEIHRDELAQWVAQAGKAGQNAPVASLPRYLQERIYGLADAFLDDYADVIGDEIQRCFASDLQSLAGTGSGARSCTVRWQTGDPPWSMLLALDEHGVKVLQRSCDLSTMSLDARLIASRRAAAASRAQGRTVADQFNSLWIELAGRMVGDLDQGSHAGYYLPAARSGILQGHRALASALIQRATLAGVQPLDVPTLSGVIADFISLLILMPSRRRSKLLPLANELERDVLSGTISMRALGSGYQEISYETKKGTIPLHRTSSMVSELAPLVLLLKHVVNDGDLLIIEEPESHLHPGNQRKFASIIAQIVRAGVRVLLTTHSDYFAGELSNCIRRNRMAPKSPDHLAPEEVGAYLFVTDESGGGSTVRELTVTGQDGIPEDNFAQVAEELYDDTVQLQEGLTY